MKLKAATTDQVLEFVKSNNGWELVDGKLQKEFLFSDFKQAFAFMTSVAKYADEKNHHPEWFNVYRRVKVDLTTHEVSGISERDFSLALKMDSVIRKMNA